MPGEGVAVRAPSRAPAGGVRPRGAPCAECLRPCARPCGAVERWPGRSWPGLAASEPATRPPGGTGSRGPRRAVPARPAATRAHAHAAAGLGRLGGRAGGGPRAGRAGAEGAPLSGAGRLPAAAAGDRTQLATSGWAAAAGRRGGGTERAGTPHSRTDLEGIAGLGLLCLGCVFFLRVGGGGDLAHRHLRGFPLALAGVSGATQVGQGRGETPGAPLRSPGGPAARRGGAGMCKCCALAFPPPPPASRQLAWVPRRPAATVNRAWMLFT